MSPPTAVGPELPPDPSLFALARVQRTARAVADRVRRALAPPGVEVKPLRVLVVDDYPDAADALAAVLELLGCPVRVCYSAAAALAAAEEFDPQVCLLDLRMPGMDGLELAARLKARAAGKPLVLVATTALSDDEARARTALAGFHEHLAKPIDGRTLVEAITRLWAAAGDRPGTPEPPG